ncbi:acyl-CoA dehydrogenase family protein [Temperatibacter marinus]|uniref:Acyl-[acyl-carrier-protein] dehydrogenase MbtN n=1 Tax=Temperatibacter marinus TaxID=1456591 RepID=A0AA52EHH5_9PROT|nr:acyl-CoA dehydrogenase family protein [Temperatibacter marinus]WND02875.1 acyl-CoA dehydrogenase family protein [Temperatibacter marinus]
MLKNRSVYNSEDLPIFRDSVRKFYEAEAVPHRDRWSDQGKVDRGFWNKLGEAGMLCPQLPEEYGGLNVDYRYCCVINEEQAYTRAGGAAIAVHSDIVAPYILEYGDEALKQKWLPKMVSGDAVGAIAMTEPGTGSDLQGIKTTAVKDGDHFIINGSKTFISNGQNCDFVLTVCKTTEEGGAQGSSIILIEADREGFKRGRNLEKIGMHSSDTSELFFDDVKVPVTNLIGYENAGFMYLMQQLPQERLSIAMIAMASSQRAFDITLAYTKERHAFGKPIVKFQNTRFELAEMKTELEVGWAFVDQCLEKHIKGELDAPTAAMSKLWTTELQSRLVDRCVQLHGGYGFMKEYEIAQHYTDSRVQRIYGGTSEIMKELIGRTL